MKRLILLILLISGIYNISSAQDVKLIASGPSTVGTGQQFTITYSLNTNGTGFKGPNFKGFSVLSGPNQQSSSNIQVVNGKMTQFVTFSYVYYLSAGNEGSFTISPASITVGGKTYQSNSLTIKVVKSAGGNAQQGQQNNQRNSNQNNNQNNSGTISANDLYIKATVSNPNPYQGEQVIVSYKLYTCVPISQPNINKLSNNKGFWQEDLLKDNEQLKIHREVIGGKQFTVAEIRKVALFPQQSGKLTIDPLAVDLIAQIQVQRKRSNSPFDIFEDAFFNSAQNVKKTINSNAVTINVKPLPTAGKPEGFSGAVGNFTFRSDIDRTEIKANDAINLKFTISGRGNIKLIDKLKIDFPPDFETYDPKVLDNISKSDNGISGTKTFEYLIIPRNQGNFTIKPITFSYFDLNKGKYVTLTSPEYNLKVNKGDGKQNTVSVTSSNQQDIKYIGSDIQYIKIKPVKLFKKGFYFFQSTLYYILLLIPFLLFITYLIIRRKHIKLRSNLALLKNKKATKVASKRLKKASQFLKSNESDKFFIEISQALWGYISDKFSIPLAELSMDSVKEALQSKSVNEEISKEFIETLHNCEFARFAPGDNATKMDKIYKESINIITKTERELK